MGSPLDLLRDRQPRFHEALGCDRCGASGYRGRTGLYDLMRVTDGIRDLIRRRASMARSAASVRKRTLPA